MEVMQLSLIFPTTYNHFHFVPVPFKRFWLFFFCVVRFLMFRRAKEGCVLQSEPHGEQVLNTKELAAKLRCSRPFIYRLMSLGQLPKGFSLGRNRRWLASEIDTWLKDKAAKAQKAR